MYEKKCFNYNDFLIDEVLKEKLNFNNTETVQKAVLEIYR